MFMVDATAPKTLEGSFKRFRFSWSLSISRINNLIRSVIWMLIVNHSLYSLKAKGENAIFLILKLACIPEIFPMSSK